MPSQANDPYAQYQRLKPPMLPQPRWSGRPTWRLLNSSDSVSPFSSGSSSRTNVHTYNSDGYSKGRWQNSGDASTLAGSESGSTPSVPGYSEKPPTGHVVYDAQQQQYVGGRCDGPYGSYYGQPYYEQGYCSVDQRAQYPQPPPGAVSNGYYNSPHMYSGVYYSVAAPPFGTAVEGSSPPYGQCSPTSDQTASYPQQYCYPEGYASHDAPGMVQPWQAMPVAQPTCPAIAYQQQQYNSPTFPMNANRHFSMVEGHQHSGVYNMPTQSHHAYVQPPPAGLYCSGEQPIPTAPYPGGYQGRWDVEVQTHRPYGHSLGSGRPVPYHEEYYNQDGGHMTSYYHTAMDNGPRYGSNHEGFPPHGDISRQVDDRSLNAVPG